jgi:hypothetical protein
MSGSMRSRGAMIAMIDAPRWSVPVIARESIPGTLTVVDRTAALCP